MEKEIVNQVQEAERVPYRISPRRNTPRHILIKLTQRKYIKSSKGETKLEMKKEQLYQTMQKYKGLEETIMNNYMAIKWITWKKWTDS